MKPFINLSVWWRKKNKLMEGISWGLINNFADSSVYDTRMSNKWTYLSWLIINMRPSRIFSMFELCSVFIRFGIFLYPKYKLKLYSISDAKFSLWYTIISKINMIIEAKIKCETTGELNFIGVFYLSIYQRWFHRSIKFFDKILACVENFIPFSNSIESILVKRNLSGDFKFTA